MGIRSALYADLIACDALTTALGTTADLPKVFPHVAKADSAFPYVTFKRVDAPDERTLLDGSVRKATFIVNAWSQDTAEAEAIVEILRPRLEAFRGDQGAHGVNIRLSNPVGEEDDDVPSEDASDSRDYVTTITVRITYTATS